MYGTHGADMHAVAYLKPSALALEVGLQSIDSIAGGDFNAGFFSQLTYSRGIGYLRLVGHMVVHQTGAWRSYSTSLSVAEWRQSLSTAVCAWLAMNAVRLADESAGGGWQRNTSTAPPAPDGPSSAASYGHLVPWWCRGGALGAVDALRNGLRGDTSSATTASAKATPPSPPPAPIGSSKVNVSGANGGLTAAVIAFLERRGEDSGFGFSVPQCPPLAPSVARLLAPTKGAVRLVTAIGQSTLNKLQTECAGPITASVRRHASSTPIRIAETLASYLEAAFGLRGRRAGALAATAVGAVEKLAASGDCVGGPRHPRYTECLGYVLRVTLAAATGQPFVSQAPSANISVRTLMAVDSAARRVAAEAAAAGEVTSLNIISSVGEAVTFLLQRLRSVELIGEAPTMPHDSYIPNERASDFSYGASLTL